MMGPNERVRAESGALMATIPTVAVEARAEGGILRSIKRAALGGESFFITTYTAPPGGGWIDVAAFLPGDLNVMEVQPGQAWFVPKGSWLASADTVTMDTKWGGFKNLFGSEGEFILRAEGQGPMVVSAYGAVEAWDLQPGQTVTLDTGHMVAYTEGLGMHCARSRAGGADVQELRGPGVRLHRPGPPADPDPQPHRVPGRHPGCRGHRQLGRHR